MLAEESGTDNPARRSLIQELRSNGAVRESLEIIPSADPDGKAVFLLNGKPVDPEIDSLGRFDSFASMLESESADQDEESDDGSDNNSSGGGGRGFGSPVYESLRGRASGKSRSIQGRRADGYEIEFETDTGDTLKGELWLAADSGYPLELSYNADSTWIIREARTEISFRLTDSGNSLPIQRDRLDIFFRIGALFLQRSYRMLIEF
ncbi:hypothetical protein JCM12856_01820 [Spirochaeta dissipatitropha]